MKPKPPVENFEFPARYSNDPGNWWKSGSWKKYTDAARDLNIKITMTDCKNFRYLLFEAERNLKVFERYLTPNCKKAVVLQHDSTVEDVVERLPAGFINNVQGPMFRTLLQELISMAKKEHQEKLYHDYTLFLMNYWDRIKTGTTAAECLEMLKDDPHFVANKFGDLESHHLEHGMQGGKRFSYMYTDKMDADYRYKRDVMWKARNRLPVELTSPIHFLAFKKRHEEGYLLHHPVKEIMKFRAYFGLFFNGVPPSLCAELWCFDPSLERQLKLVCHC